MEKSEGMSSGFEPKSTCFGSKTDLNMFVCLWCAQQHHTECDLPFQSVQSEIREVYFSRLDSFFRSRHILMYGQNLADSATWTNSSLSTFVIIVLFIPTFCQFVIVCYGLSLQYRYRIKFLLLGNPHDGRPPREWESTSLSLTSILKTSLRSQLSFFNAGRMSYQPCSSHGYGRPYGRNTRATVPCLYSEFALLLHVIKCTKSYDLY